jgi:hypothetical protein
LPIAVKVLAFNNQGEHWGLQVSPLAINHTVNPEIVEVFLAPDISTGHSPFISANRTKSPVSTNINHEIAVTRSTFETRIGVILVLFSTGATDL